MEMPPSIELDIVKEFVGNSHGDLGKVKALLAQEPALINSAWDWGGGDFETGLGAASHMGNRTIAEFLLEKGAHIDLFAAAMLGKLKIVKATIESFPISIDTPGPHGIPLIKHAEMGGEEAKDVLDYLLSIKK